MEQVIIGGKNNDLHATNTEYNVLYGAVAWSTLTGRRQVFPSSGNLTKFRVELAAAPGSGKSYTFTIVINGSPTDLTFAISNLDASGEITTDVAVSAGDLAQIKCVPDGTPTAVYARWSTVFEGTTAKESVLLGYTTQQGTIRLTRLS